MMTSSTIQIITTHQINTWDPIEGPHTRNLRQKLVRDLGELPSNESFEKVRSEASRILSSCLPPGEAPDRRTGLVVGCVQSGKTMSITTVTALARDNRYRVVVVLAGTAKNLVKQTQERLEEQLGTDDWLVLPNPTPQDKSDLINCVNEWRNPRIRSERHKGILCVVMKHRTHIGNLTKLLRGIDVSNTNALIFDDEADQASLNTRPNQGRSPIYSSIEDLRNSLPRHTFLQYTATPQAPLLISLLDSLSPDFADTIEPGDGYVGGRDFFQDHPELVNDIDDQDDNEEESPPKSLKGALRLFFLGAAATQVLAERNAQMTQERLRSMLVHPSRHVAPHSDYATIIERIKRDWTTVMSRTENDDERTELIEEFRQSHVELKKTFPELPNFDDLVEHLTLEISRAKISIINSDCSDVPWKRHNTHILVGGQKLDRGYTVKGLTVTHMAREPGAGNYDTIQQRARFFGYKRKYLGLCRVYLQPDVREAFQNYVIHEEVLRDALRRHGTQSLKTWRRIFHLEPGFRLTRSNVHDEDYFRPSRGEWFLQQEPHLPDPTIRADNNATLERFVAELGAQPDDKWAQAGHHVGMTSIKKVQALLGEIVTSAGSDFSTFLVAQFALEHVVENWDNLDVQVYLMGWSKRPRQRTPREGDRSTINLHQGASPSKSSDAYPGDAHVRDPERVTLQIHRVQISPRDKGIPSLPVLAIALRLPSHFNSNGFVFQPKRRGI